MTPARATPGQALPGHAAPAASLEVPLEMLAACHHRVERQCDTLHRLVAHLARHGNDADAHSAAQAVMRYFDTAARDHHADEEEDLFPALREAMAGSDAVCIRALAERLVREHRTLEAAWQQLRARLQALVDGAPDAALPAAEVESFTALYAGHIAHEEAELLPMAARLLDSAALEQIGRAMRRRRGLDPLP